MARKYQTEFTVTMTVKSEDAEDTVKDITRELKAKAASVSDLKIEIGEVVQTYPVAPVAPAPQQPIAGTVAPEGTLSQPAPVAN
jgi:hypothetical protein